MSYFRDLHSRQHLDLCLSRAVGVGLENGRLKLIDNSHYVLTMDYTIKMLSIHERMKCRMPVIIQGETGVGKTALLKMISDLWNQSFVIDWSREKGRLCGILKDHVKQLQLSQDIIKKCFVSSIFLNVYVTHKAWICTIPVSEAWLSPWKKCPPGHSFLGTIVPPDIGA